MKKQILVGLGIAFGLVLTLALIKYLQISAAMAEQAGMKMPPEAVTTIEVQPLPWPETLEVVGTLSAVQGVVLRAEGEGNVTKINVDSGAAVTAGTVLVELDTAVEEAELKAALAERDKAQKAYTRAKNLVTESATSRATLESNEAAFRSAEAQVASLQAQIAKKRIVAPFSGKLGVRRVNLGEYVSTGAEVIPLFDLTTLHFDFSVPERVAGRISAGLAVEAQIDSFPDRIFRGAVDSFDPQIDEKTRNLKVRALLKNADGSLKPGMFARAGIVLSPGETALAIPTSSINYAPYGDTVYVVQEMADPAGQKYLGVRSQIVELGAKRGNQVVVSSGLTPGEVVVTSGTFKLRPGAAVVVHNELAPANENSPKPSDS